MRPRIARAKAGRSWPWELLVFVTCRVSCRHEQRKGGRCREIGGRVGAECAPFEGGWRTLRTHRPDPASAVSPVMQRRLGGKRWEKLSQRIMSRERETLRVCQLSHYIFRDCIRSYVLVSNGKIGSVQPAVGVGVVGRGIHAGDGWNYSPALGEAEGRHTACPYLPLRGRQWLRC